MTKAVKRIAVTGAAGQIAYNLLFRLASGEVFGHDQPIALHLLELPEAFKALEGVKMELEDCAFPLLQEIHIGTDPFKVFMGVHHALLVGSKPRGPGMERAELLQDNGKIFIHQGKALNDCADRNVQVLVVGNPCNTNCLITLLHAPRIPRKNFHAMTRLDQNRACALLAARANVNVGDVSHMAIWGNHSSTQVPDFYHANIKGQPFQRSLRIKIGSKENLSRRYKSAGQRSLPREVSPRQLQQPMRQWMHRSRYYTAQVNGFRAASLAMTILMV